MSRTSPTAEIRQAGRPNRRVATSPEDTSHERDRSYRLRSLSYAFVCVGIVAVAALTWGERFGTQHWPIHAAALVLAAVYCATAQDRDGLQVLGLRWPGYSRWIWIMLLLGVLSALARTAVYWQTGIGGLALYQRDFVPAVSGASFGEMAARWALFAVVLYLSVLIPGILFCALIQGLCSRAGLFFLGLLLQSLSFGLVHCFMTGSFNLVYGMEALGGAVVYGIAYARLKNLYVPALFMATNVLASTALLAAWR